MSANDTIDTLPALLIDQLLRHPNRPFTQSAGLPRRDPRLGQATQAQQVGQVLGVAKDRS